MFVEDEMLLGVVENTGFEEDETFGSDDAAELLPVPGDDRLLSVSGIEASELLVPSEDSALDDELTSDRLL